MILHITIRKNNTILLYETGLYSKHFVVSRNMNVLPCNALNVSRNTFCNGHFPRFATEVSSVRIEIASTFSNKCGNKNICKREIGH